jgi:hypothetical protein
MSVRITTWEVNDLVAAHPDLRPSVHINTAIAFRAIVLATLLQMPNVGKPLR